MINCNCKISPILKDITLQYSDGINVIDLNKYRTILINPNHLEKLKSCLKEHGFIGSISEINSQFSFTFK